MNQHKIVLAQLPIILFFLFCYWVTELGVRGQLENSALRETFYPNLSRASNFLTDLKLNSRGAQPPKNRIVVVEIDGNSIANYGRWPWHRDLTALLIEKTFEAGAKVVGLDIAFAEPDPRVPPELAEYLSTLGAGRTRFPHLNLNQFESDEKLADLIRVRGDNLVLGWASETECQPLYAKEEVECPVLNPDALSLFPKNYERFSFDYFNTLKGFDAVHTPLISFVTPLANIPLYSDIAKHIGYFNSSLDSDGTIRRSNLVAIAQAKPFASLPLEMARVGLGEKLQVTLDEQQRVKSLGFSRSGQMIPVTPLGVMQINFRGPNSVFTRISALDLLNEKETLQNTGDSRTNGLKKSDILKDAYVFVGLSALGVFDMRQFPFESNAPGVYGHANILDNILTGDPLSTELSRFGGLGVFLIYFLMLFGAAGFAFAIERLDAVPAMLLFTLGVLIFWLLDFKVMFRMNYNLNTVFIYLEAGIIFILTLAAKYVAEERNKKFIRSAFVKYVAPDVVDSILSDPSKLSLGGEKKELTVLFSDIRGFTTFSETMDAKALAAFLNDYLGIMTRLVFSNQGTLDKYIGDAIMAFWGAPLSQGAHAFNSCKAALEMSKALRENHERFKTQYGIDVKVGIGINSGSVNVGNMGSDQNFAYTVIGDQVNLASRIEGLTKIYGVAILTSRFTLDSIKTSGHPLPFHRVLDHVKVKGKNNSVELIQVLESDFPVEGLRLFEEGRVLYRATRWDEAIVRLTSAGQILSDKDGNPDRPTEIFIERCKYFKETPPRYGWDGSWEMDTK